MFIFGQKKNATTCIQFIDVATSTRAGVKSMIVLQPLQLAPFSDQCSTTCSLTLQLTMTKYDLTQL